MVSTHAATSECPMPSAAYRRISTSRRLRDGCATTRGLARRGLARLGWRAWARCGVAKAMAALPRVLQNADRCCLCDASLVKKLRRASKAAASGCCHDTICAARPGQLSDEQWAFSERSVHRSTRCRAVGEQRNWPSCTLCTSSRIKIDDMTAARFALTLVSLLATPVIVAAVLPAWPTAAESLSVSTFYVAYGVTAAFVLGTIMLGQAINSNPVAGNSGLTRLEAAWAGRCRILHAPTAAHRAAVSAHLNRGPPWITTFDPAFNLADTRNVWWVDVRPHDDPNHNATDPVNSARTVSVVWLHSVTNKLSCTCSDFRWKGPPNVGAAVRPGDPDHVFTVVLERGSRARATDSPHVGLQALPRPHLHLRRRRWTWPIRQRPGGHNPPLVVSGDGAAADFKLLT